VNTGNWTTFRKSPIVQRRINTSHQPAYRIGGYAGRLVIWAKKILSSTVEVVTRTDDVTGFAVLPRRWVVERTFAWLNRNRRLAKDVEATIESSVTWLYIASVKLMSRRPAAV